MIKFRIGRANEFAQADIRVDNCEDLAVTIGGVEVGYFDATRGGIFTRYELDEEDMTTLSALGFTAFVDRKLEVK